MKIKQGWLAGLLSICLIGNSLASTVHYYYQGAEISAVDVRSQTSSFVLVGQDRMSELSTGLQNHARYLLGDGKSHALFLSQSVDDHSNDLSSSQDSIAIDYQGYGQRHVSLDSSSISNFGYNGEYQDPGTNLTYLRARDYDAVHQHFITMDSYPLLNRYHFTNQDPINQIDPSGHQSIGQWWDARPGWQKGLMIGGGVLIAGGLLRLTYS